MDEIAWQAVMSDGILVPSQSSRQGDKIKILSGGSQSQRAVDLIKTLQYSGCTSLKILENIKYELNECNKRRAVCVYMHMPGTNIHTPGLPHSVIPILPEKTSFKYNIPGQKGYNVSRSQLPLLPAYTYTANKIQGQSLKHALVDLKSAQGTQALYVMIFHTMVLDNLVITRWFLSTNVNRQFDRLEKLDQPMKQDFQKRK